MAGTSQAPYFQGDSQSTTNLLSPGPSNPRGPPSIRSVASSASFQSDSHYASSLGDPRGKGPLPPSISDKFAMSPDPSAWGGALSMDVREADDHLHTPDPRRDRKIDQGGTIFTCRGIANLGCLLFLGLGMATLFAAWPLVTHFTKKPISNNGGFNLGGTNATGQVPSMAGNWGLIDLETPKEAYTKLDYHTGKDWQLIFSDEFNVEGRSFYPGDDPYWEAVDLHYWQTNNMEWYDPAAITTRNGSLEITLSATPNHGMNYTGGMMSTWNKFCFTGGLIETSVVLPGANNIVGLWPAIWTMGNLGRAGFGASLEGMWPYTYDSCDVGTVANQTLNGLPLAAIEKGDEAEGGVLSFLPGQRLSRCTCPGESHPGPIHSDGTYVGRSAPEIDIFEAQITGDPLSGQPFNAEYKWLNTTDNLVIPNTTLSFLNPYRGGAFQQATSVVTETNQEAYEDTGNVYSIYGFQYKPGFEDAYISWISDGQLVWTLMQSGMAADTQAEIGPRPIPQEPMYIIANLGMSRNFGFVDLEHLHFPAIMKVDWVRVYQDPDNMNIGCDPPDFPTATYIQEYLDSYTNPNLTTWRDDYGQPFPKNSFLGQC
ncbi:unnamed protein product [Somion occarium]|uniref:GH16 domain-containing protein n=1 Tax=Somion occarium TaxID=3059160 RepID=A0ABP1CLH7_9APHY